MNLDKIKAAGILKVTSVTCDASAQLEKVVRNHSISSGHPIKHYHCFIHRLRTLQKKIKNITLSSLPCKDRDNYSQRLATCIRTRVRLELVRIQQATLVLFEIKAQAATF